MIDGTGTTETKTNQRGSGSALNCFVIFMAYWKLRRLLLVVPIIMLYLCSFIISLILESVRGLGIDGWWGIPTLFLVVALGLIVSIISVAYAIQHEKI